VELSLEIETNSSPEFIIVILEFFNYSQQQQKFYRKIEKITLSRIRDKFDTNFREKTFIDSLSEFVESFCN
jgi:hypothetical protein